MLLEGPSSEQLHLLGVEWLYYSTSNSKSFGLEEDSGDKGAEASNGPFKEREGAILDYGGAMLTEVSLANTSLFSS